LLPHRQTEKMKKLKMELSYGGGNNGIYHTLRWSRHRINKKNKKVTFTVTMFLGFFNEF
jgi:hypothetical protein